MLEDLFYNGLMQF